MAGIKFDFIGNDDSFIKTIDHVRESMAKTAKTLEGLGESFNIDGIANQMLTLTMGIRQMDETILKSKQNLAKWANDAANVRGLGDIDTYNTIQKDIEDETASLREFVKEKEEYMRALDELNTLRGSISERAPMFFNSQSEYDAMQELKDKILDVQSQIANFNGSEEDLGGLRAELSDLNAELQQSEIAAAQAAEQYGANGQIAATITERYYSLTRAISEQEKTVARLRAEYRQAGANLQEATESNGDVETARVLFDNLGESVRGAEMHLSNLRREYNQYSDELQKLRKEPEELKLGLDGADTASGKLADTIKSIGALVGISFGVGAIKDFIENIKSVRSDFQDIESSMKVFLGNQEKSDEFTQKLKDYAYYNMFEFKDLAKASQQMIAYGQDVDSIIPRLDQLSNVAVGTHGSLLELVDAYNRAKSTGVVDARGIQSWAVKGVVIKDVLRDMGETAVGTSVTFEQLNKVLEHITSEGGMFHNLQGEMMENISAERGQLADNLDAMFNEIGQKYQDIITEGYKLAGDVVNDYQAIGGGIIDATAGAAGKTIEFLREHYQLLSDVIINGTIAIGSWRVALLAANAAQKIGSIITAASTMATAINTGAVVNNQIAKGTATTATVLLTGAQNALNASMLANPYTWVAAGLAALVFATVKIATAESSLAKGTREANDELERQGQILEERKTNIESLIRTIQDPNATDYSKLKAYNDLKVLAKDITDAYTQEELALLSLDEAQKAVNKTTDDAEYEQAKKNVEEYTKKIDELKEQIATAATPKTQEERLGDLYYNPDKERLKTLQAELDVYKQKLKEIEDIRAEIAENARPIEVRVAEAESNVKAKEDILAFFDKIGTSITESNDKLTDMGERVSDGFKGEVVFYADTARAFRAAAEVEGIEISPKFVRFVANDEDVIKKIGDIEGVKIDEKKLTVIPETEDAVRRLLEIDGLRLSTKGMEVKANTEAAFSSLLEIEGMQLQPVSFAIDTSKAQSAVKDAQAANDSLNFDTAQREADEYVEHVQTEIAALKAKLVRDPNNVDLRLELTRKEEVLKELEAFQTQLRLNPMSVDVLINTFYNRAQQGLDAATGDAPEGWHWVEDRVSLGGRHLEKDAEEETKTSKQWYADRHKVLKAAQKDLDDFLAGRGEYAGKEYTNEKYEEELTKKRSALQSAKAAVGDNRKQLKAAKEAGRRRAAELQDEWKHQEELEDLIKKGARARVDAEISAIQDEAERVRAERATQHERALQDLTAQTADIYKAIYDQRKKAWEREHKDSPYELTEQGGRGWGESAISGTLSESEQELFDARLAIITAGLSKENSEYSRYLEERERQERQYLYDYMREYGDIEAQRESITRDYDAKIAEESNAVQKAALEQQKQTLLDELNLKEIQDSINWETVFNDMTRVSTEALSTLRDQLRAQLGTGGLSAENAQIISEKLLQAENEISQRTNVFASLIPALQDRVRLANEASVAEAEVAAAQERQNKALEEEAAQRARIQGMLSAFGLSVNASDINSGLQDTIFKTLGLDPLSEGGKALTEAFQTLKLKTIDLGKATEEAADAVGKLKSVNDLLKGFKGKGIGGAVSDIFSNAVQSAGGGMMGMVSVINNNIQSLPALMEELGLSDTGFGESVAAFAEGTDSFVGAIQSFASGDFVGGITGLIKGFKSWGHIFGSGGNSAKVAETIERLNERNSELISAIEDLTRSMENAAPAQAVDLYKKAVDYQKEINKNSLDIAKAQAGYHNAHHSFNYYWQGYSQDEIRSFSKQIGREWNGDIWSLTPEEMKLLRGNIELWDKIENTGEGGYGKRVAETLNGYIENAGSLTELVEQLNTSLTQVSFDSMYDSFVSKVMDMNTTAKDLANDFEGYLQQAVIKGMMNEQVKPLLDKWWRGFARAMEDGTLSLTERDRLLAQGGTYTDMETGMEETYQSWDAISQMSLQLRDNMSNLFGWTGSEYSQSASGKAFSTMSQDEGEELNGRFTALQIAGEGIHADTTEILTNVLLLVNITQTYSSHMTELRDMAITRNSFLEDIAKYCKSMYTDFTQKLDNISTNTNRL